MVIKNDEVDPFLCMSMTNNVKSYKKINGRAQIFRFSVFAIGRLELLAKKKQGKQGRLKRILLKFLSWYDVLRGGPCEKARPQLSEYV